MKVIDLTEETQLNQIIEESAQSPKGVLIFKHSTRCAISKMVLDRFKRGWSMSEDEMRVYYLDLVRYRNVSNVISQKFEVQHESPQVLLIKDGSCVYHASHNAISPQIIAQEA